MENIQTISPIDWNNERVITTAQLAAFYKCSEENIRNNFNKNKNRFSEGSHYFKLKGSEIYRLRISLGYDQIPAKTRIIYLWTARGAARHAKLLATDEAWAVYGKLEDSYFNQQAAVVANPADTNAESANAKSANANTEPTNIIIPNPLLKPPFSSPKLVRPEIKSEYARVYALDLSNSTVKVGQTTRFRARVSEIEQPDLLVRDLYFSPDMSVEDARFIEWACLKKFSSRRVTGEFLDVPFAEVCAAIKSLLEFLGILTRAEKIELGNKLLKAAEMMTDSPERQAVIVEAVNLFVDKKLF